MAPAGLSGGEDTVTAAGNHVMHSAAFSGPAILSPRREVSVKAGLGTVSP